MILGEETAAGQMRTVRGVWDASAVALQDDGYSYGMSVTVSSSEPVHRAFKKPFSETVTKDSRGLTRSIKTGRSVASPFAGRPSPWIAHRALDIIFPGEPVGQDAQWKVVRSLELDDGLSVDVEAVYELKHVAADFVVITYSLDVERTPVPKRYAMRSSGGDADPVMLAKNRPYVSVTCAGKAVQYLSAVLPKEAELVCRVTRETKRGKQWLNSADGQQINIRVKSADE